MIKNADEFVKSILEKGVNNKGSIYSQIIKNERIRRNMTLEETAKGICSVSYLCKLENYAIKSKKQFIRALFEKLNLNYDKIDSNNTETLTEEIIKDYFYEKDEEIDSKYRNTLTIPFSSSSQIVRCFYHLIHNEYEHFEHEFKILENIKYTLGGMEGIVLIYLLILYKMQRNLYFDAYKYLKMIEILDGYSRYLSYLILEANIITSLYTRKYCLLQENYNKFEKIDFVGYPIGRKLIMKMIYNFYKSEEYPMEVIDEIISLDINTIPSNNKLDVLYYYYLIRMRKGKLIDIFGEIIDNTYYADPRFLGIITYISYKLNQKEIYKEVLSLVENYTFEDKDFIHQRFICFVMLYASKVDMDDLIAYMRKDIIPLVNTEVCLLYNEVYSEIFLNHLINTSKYKESYYFLKNSKTLL